MIRLHSTLPRLVFLFLLTAVYMVITVSQLLLLAGTERGDSGPLLISTTGTNHIEGPGSSCRLRAAVALGTLA